MRALRLACFALLPSAAVAADSNPAPKSSGMIQLRTCEGAVAKLKPGQPAKLQKLGELPPAEVYAAGYYSDGCPVRLVEARGGKRR